MRTHLRARLATAPILERVPFKTQRPLDRVPREPQVARDRADRLPVYQPPPADLADRLHAQNPGSPPRWPLCRAGYGGGQFSMSVTPGTWSIFHAGSQPRAQYAPELRGQAPRAIRIQRAARRSYSCAEFAKSAPPLPPIASALARSFAATSSQAPANMRQSSGVKVGSGSMGGM